MRRVNVVALLQLNTAVFAQKIKASTMPGVVKEKFAFFANEELNKFEAVIRKLLLQ